MLRRRAIEAAAAVGVAALITLMIAAPVLRAPAERIFGAEIVGRHHDPFTVMQQFEHPFDLGLYAQPLTELTGAAIARATGAVAAYNWLVLLSFPLSALAAFLLARHLLLPPAAALFASLLFAFSPFHLAQAAYHPHIAQTQWLPLYLLALWRCLDAATPRAVALLAAAAAAVTLSNFYGVLIAATLTPVAIGIYWLARARFEPRAGRQLGVTLAALVCVALAGAAFVGWRAGAVWRHPAAFAFPREDLYRYSAKWWSYLVPPVANPVLGARASRLWLTAGVDAGLLEQQVSLGWSVIVLALVASVGWLTSVGRGQARRSEYAVPVLATLGAAALICSLSPERTTLGVRVLRPSALLYAIVPMFRAYARFGVIVQLAAALLAGIGAARLFAHGTRGSRWLTAGLVLCAIGEYTVSPAALSRDVLPTAAHRWVADQTDGSRALDCAPLSDESASIAWLTGGRITLADPGSGDCAEPQLAAKLSAAGFSRLIVRDSWQRQWLRDHGEAEGLHQERRFADADVFAIRPRERLYTQTIAGFWPREHGDGATWRWMGTDAAWTIVAPASRRDVTLSIDLQAFHHSRPLTVRLDEGVEQTIDVAARPQRYQIGPLALDAGTHRLTFHSSAPATMADRVIGNGDRRALSIAMGAWHWSTP